jgi:predicted dehydrogenase
MAPRGTESGREIRVALVGFGYAGRVFHAPLISATHGLRLAVIGSSQAEAVRSAHPDVEVVSTPGAAARHPDADLVVIATPNAAHATLAEAALLAGKHVVVDKPFTITPAEARALVALAAQVGRILTVFQNRRWDSDFLAIREELSRGRIGEVVELRSEMSRYRPEVRDRWRERAVAGSGIWYDLGPHLIDQVMLLFGTPHSVGVDLQIQRRGGEAVDWFHAVLGYGPARAILASSMVATDAPARFVVRGTRGSLVKRRGDPQEELLARGIAPGSPGWGQDLDPLIVHDARDGTTAEAASPAGAYPEYYRAVRDAIRDGTAPPVTPLQASSLMAVIEAGIRSSAEGRVVRPDFTDEERSAWG